MKKINQSEMEGTQPEDTEKLNFKPLIADNMNPPNFCLRLFDIYPGGHTPRHAHAWEHELFVVEGTGKIILKDREEKLIPGDAIFVEPKELHQFVNDGEKTFRLICVIPKPSGN